MSIEKPANAAQARQRLSHSFDEAIVLLSEARLIASKHNLAASDFENIQRLCGESRNVPLTIALHDLWDALHQG